MFWIFVRHFSNCVPSISTRICLFEPFFQRFSRIMFFKITEAIFKIVFSVFHQKNVITCVPCVPISTQRSEFWSQFFHHQTNNIFSDLINKKPVYFLPFLLRYFLNNCAFEYLLPFWNRISSKASDNFQFLAAILDNFVLKSSQKRTAYTVFMYDDVDSVKIHVLLHIFHLFQKKKKMFYWFSGAILEIGLPVFVQKSNLVPSFDLTKRFLQSIFPKNIKLTFSATFLLKFQISAAIFKNITKTMSFACFHLTVLFFPFYRYIL